MAMIACSECSGSISSVATTCPHCGKPQPGHTGFNCDKCYVSNDPYAASCRSCGASLEAVRSRREKYELYAYLAALCGGIVSGFFGCLVGGFISHGMGAANGSFAAVAPLVLGTIWGGLIGGFMIYKFLVPWCK